MDTKIVEKERAINDFYQRARLKINRWFEKGNLNKKSGKWTDRFVQYLLTFPDLIHLMIKLFTDRGVSSTVKGYILVVFTYLLSPIDIIPDFIPVAGFIDDLLVLVIILNKIINSADEDLKKRIGKYWAGEDDVFEKVKEITSVMNELSAQLPKSLYKFMKNKNDINKK